MISQKAMAKSWPYSRHDAYERELRKVAASWFASKGFPVQKKYPFILAEWEDWPRNIILEDVAEHIKAQQAARIAGDEGFPLHKYIHHGLSSQAMLFNLIGPLIVKEDLALLKPLFESRGIEWPCGKITGEFEVEDRDVFQEQYGQPTSIDLVISRERGPSIFIESKLVERKFGGCSVFETQGDCNGRNPANDFDSCYLHHIGRTYWPQMKQHGFLEGPLRESTICPLANYYQFFREVIFAVHKGGYFVLLHDERNPSFVAKAEGLPERGTFSFLISLLPEPLKNRVKSITIQEVLKHIKGSPGNKWASEFEAKYGLARYGTSQSQG